jgi:CheY-like chemotaxis protein
MSKQQLLILDKDVYVLTPEGSREIRGTATNLTPAEIELLVCIDGHSTVGQIKQRRLTLSVDAVDEGFTRLVTKHLIEISTAGSAAQIPVGDRVGSSAAVELPSNVRAFLEKEAESGISSLKDKGYFVRVARRSAVKREKPKDHRLSAVVIEDEPYLAKFVRTYLALEDFDARVASNRAEVIAELRRQPAPDLVLLDVTLPDADGFDILRKIREHPALRVVPVIMVTGNATREGVLKGLAAGADGYITKPFEPDNLVATIRAVLGLEK